MLKALWVVVLVQAVALFLVWAQVDRQSYSVDKSRVELTVYIDRIQSIERDIYGANLDEGPKTRRPVTEDW